MSNQEEREEQQIAEARELLDRVHDL